MPAPSALMHILISKVQNSHRRQIKINDSVAARDLGQYRRRRLRRRKTPSHFQIKETKTKGPHSDSRRSNALFTMGPEKEKPSRQSLKNEKETKHKRTPSLEVVLNRGCVIKEFLRQRWYSIVS